MKKIICLLMIIAMLSVLFACVKEKPVNAPKRTITEPSPTKYDNSNVNTDKQNTSLARNDASQALSIFMTLKANEDGTAELENGMIFAVKRAGTTFFFEYRDGELIDLDTEPLLGEEVTPEDPTWLSGVKVYLP